MVIIVEENMYGWSEWEITNSTHEYEKKSVHRVEFPVTVKKDAEAVLTYTIRYRW